MTDPNAKRLPERFLAAVQAGEPKAMQAIAQELSFSRDRCLADGTPLVCAVAGTGNIEAMQILLARRYALITHDPRIPAPVQVAVRNGHLPMLEFLLEKGEQLFPPFRVAKKEDPYRPGPVGLSSVRKSDIVWEAFQSGNPAMLAFVVERLGPVGPDWFVADAQGCHVLHHVLTALLEGDPRGPSD
ncbi:hypothetical protein KBA41_16680, partial [Candidatus Ozemobacteraceae bacterium]|nr:hypothetical protein [Candidatus Ozemobacteraceae bacterium]